MKTSCVKEDFFGPDYYEMPQEVKKYFEKHPSAWGQLIDIVPPEERSKPNSLDISKKSESQRTNPNYPGQKSGCEP